MLKKLFWIYTENLFCFLLLITIAKSLSSEKHVIKFLQNNVSNVTTITSLIVKSNVATPSIEFQYRQDDDTFKSFSVFYNKHIQVLKSIHSGEVDLGEPKYKFNCFVMFYDVHSIPPVKLIINRFEELGYEDILNVVDHDLGSKTWITGHIVMKKQLSLFGEEIHDACKEADLVLTTPSEVQRIADKLGLPILQQAIAPQSSLRMEQYPLCHQANSDWELSCQCQTSILIGWYPCGAKICENNENALIDDEDNALFPCGMKSCKQENRFYKRPEI